MKFIVHLLSDESKRLCFFDSAPRRKAVSAITGMYRQWIGLKAI